MSDAALLQFVVALLREHADNSLPMSPAAARRALVAIEELRTERREKAVSATI